MDILLTISYKISNNHINFKLTKFHKKFEKMFLNYKFEIFEKTLFIAGIIKI